jgi:hypothetical protein
MKNNIIKKKKMNCKNEVLKGVCFGFGQSIAGIIFLTIFGKKIYKYMIKSFKEIDTEVETKVETECIPDLNMQKLYNDTIKEKEVTSDEYLLSDGETIKIKPRFILNKF